jgi:glycosyltransferase involved in cell wall biosynthesis
LHIGIYDRKGGAAIAAYRQHQALKQCGVDSQMYVRFKVADDENVIPYKPPIKWMTRARRVTRRERIARMRQRARLQGEFFAAESEYGGDIIKRLPQADIINLQFAWGFVDYPAFLSAVPRAIPIIVTMHEMSPFTGGCSYTAGCENFHRECGNCPKLGARGPADYSHLEWVKRREAYAARPAGKLHFVADSHWIAAQAQTSGLLRDKPVSVIHYGLDTNIYKPLDKSAARRAFNIPTEVRVLSFASASWSDERKGMHYLAEALSGMDVKPFLLTWGRNFDVGVGGVERLHLGNIEDEHLMALAYGASDVFVMPSVEEAFGQTALEAIACGVPVAAFAAGGIPETVRHEETGLLANVGDSAELQANIERLLADDGLREHCGNNGVEIAKRDFSYALNARRYTSLYHELLG